MKTNLDCFPCLLKQTLKTTRSITDDEKVQFRVLKKTLSILECASLDDPPPTIADQVHKNIRKITKCDDPYFDIKKEYNDIALSEYDKYKKIVDQSDDPIHTAIKLATAGNIVDFGVDHKFNLEETINRVLKSDFAIDDYDKFIDKLNSAKTVYYLLDNSGEIVFDKILIEEIQNKYPDIKITVVLKGGPIINDVTYEDAKYVGLTDIKNLEFEKVSNGDETTGPMRNSKEFIDKMNKADIVISKGQGNFEALSEQNYFFLLMAKCDLVASHLDVQKGDFILKGSK